MNEKTRECHTNLMMDAVGRSFANLLRILTM